MNNQYVKYAAAIAAGMAVIALGDRLLGAKIEVFYGMTTFTLAWTLDVFLVPFISGLAVSAVVRSRMGKWLSFLPPLFVRSLSYLYMYLYVYNDGKDFFYHLNVFYWGLCVILSMEAANIGGLLGDVLTGAYGTRPKAKSALAKEMD
ncbi:MAG TPA: hypothetical protein VKC56_06985 [Gallionellaceae bacterium]|nr:hypothetical protein [Gallionellaceae bacterium]